MGSIPGLGAAMEGMSDEDTGNKLKRMIYIMDSMRADELDSDGLIFVSLENPMHRRTEANVLNHVDATGQGRPSLRTQ